MKSIIKTIFNMKLDSNIYKEAQRAARFPRLRLLMLGVVCGAVVPTIYVRNYFMPRFRREALQDVSAIAGNDMTHMEEGSVRKTKPIMKLWPMLNEHRRQEMQDNLRTAGDEMTDDSALVMFSSIM